MSKPPLRPVYSQRNRAASKGVSLSALDYLVKTGHPLRGNTILLHQIHLSNPLIPNHFVDATYMVPHGTSTITLRPLNETSDWSGGEATCQSFRVSYSAYKHHCEGVGGSWWGVGWEVTYSPAKNTNKAVKTIMRAYRMVWWLLTCSYYSQPGIRPDHFLIVL